MNKRGFDTVSVRGGYETEKTTNSTIPPIYMTNSFVFNDTEHARSLFALEKPGNIYTRLMNPTSDVLEKRLSELEGGVGGLAASSGHGAMVMMFLCLASAGDEIVSAASIYGGAVNMMSKTLKKMGITVRFVNADDPENFRRATNDRTRAYFLETIANPNADIPDLEAIASIAHEHGIPMIADNTIATPYLFSPFEHGADIIVHSASKFLTGNSTSMIGVIVDGGTFKWKDNPRFPEFNAPDESYHGIVYADACGDAAFITKMRTHILRDVGACPSPFNSWLTLLGMETLSLRVKKHCESSLEIAEYLERHSKISSVSYPGLKSSKYYSLAKKYMPKGQSSVFSFNIEGGRESAARFCDSLKLIPIVTNLGDARTIVSCPAATTHSQLSDERLLSVGINPGTVRISVGLEDVSDLLADIEQALGRIG